MQCYVCEDTSEQVEVTHFPHLYVNGSEGCNLCLNCRITLTDLVRGMRIATTRMKMKTMKKMREEKQNG